MLSTAHHVKGESRTFLLKPAYVNHRCTVWVRESLANYRWMSRHVQALCDEHTYRYGNVHHYRQMGLVDWFWRCSPAKLEGETLTPFAEATKGIHGVTAVQSYRLYYRKTKSKLLTYKRRKPPVWVQDLVRN